MERLHTYENFLTIEECESILKKCITELELKPGLVGSNDVNARKSSVAFIDNIDIIDDKLTEYLRNLNESGDNTIQLDKGIGRMYIFFSNLRHRVMKVTSGTRYSLVNWVSLKKIEDFKNTLI